MAISAGLTIFTIIAMIGGYMFDMTGNNTLMLTICIPAALICAFCFVGLGPYLEFGHSSPDTGDAPAKARS